MFVLHISATGQILPSFIQMGWVLHFLVLGEPQAMISYKRQRQIDKRKEGNRREKIKLR